MLADTEYGTNGTETYPLRNMCYICDVTAMWKIAISVTGADTLGLYPASDMYGGRRDGQWVFMGISSKTRETNGEIALCYCKK